MWAWPFSRLPTVCVHPSGDEKKQAEEHRHYNIAFHRGRLNISSMVL